MKEPFLKVSWSALSAALLLAAAASCPTMGLAELQGGTIARTAVVDSQGLKRYLFILDEPRARNEDAAGEAPARGASDPENASDIYGWHKPSVRALVKRLERQYGMQARRMTSWAAPSFSAHVSDETLERMRRDPNIDQIVPVMQGDIYPSTWNDRVDGSEYVSWGKIAIGTDDLVGTGNRVYLLDAVVRSSVDLDACCPDANLSFDSNAHNSGHFESGYVGVAGHATHVAGILAAKANGYGTRGVNNGAKVTSVNIGYFASLDDLTSAMDWILLDTETRGIFAVANLSYNFTSTGGIAATVNKYIRRASNRVLFVQSAGNNHRDACSDAYNRTNSADGILVIGGIDKEGREALNFWSPGYSARIEAGSNFGECVEAWAPSKDILSSYFNPADPLKGNYAYRSMSGTSMAAPHVAALAARYGSNATTPVQRELFIRSKLFATGWLDYSGRPIVVPSFTQASSFSVPARLAVSAVYASHTGPGYSPSYTIDSLYIDTNSWNAGRGVGPDAEVWIEYDLGATKTLRAIRMVPDQWPYGAAVHEIYAGNAPAPQNLIATVSADGAILEPFAAELNASGRYVRVKTVSSPSWVAWREIEIYGF